MKKYTIILLLISAGLLGVGIYFLLNPTDRPAILAAAQNEKASIRGDAEEDPDVKTMQFNTYTNFDYHVTFKYPNDWKIKEDKTNVRFYSPELLNVTNNSYTEKSDVLVEFETKLPKSAKELFVNESKFDAQEKDGKETVYFERVDPTTKGLVAFYVVQEGDKIITFSYPAEHPYSNFIKYMVESVNFFEE